MNSAVWCDGKEWVYKKNATDVAVDVGQPFAVYCAIKCGFRIMYALSTAPNQGLQGLLATNSNWKRYLQERQIAPPEKDPQTGALSPVVLGASIGGGIVAVLISMCIIGLFLRVRHLKRKAHEYNHESELQEMETAKEINTAKEMAVVDSK
ncbi:hypothetical protein PRIPAC_75833 [Pristionchus pacificus]|uniref:Uncharacterized protein n=1 Tax=Pristionchus pacificus TaxID=54126 RepID=A0A2A6BRB3_PRIPA|nr:hypothetical protein PRIPAC_75833 [Pristionchus pacificus]|eukprot:PDM68469.1 hypothetical protein PRIPAC_43971 [Pristionchus pacificus]